MKPRRVDFWPDEWIAGTFGLDNAERGLYITACALIYSHGGPIPIEHLKAACPDHGHAFKRQLNQLLSTDKLSLNDGQIDNKRCAKELQKVVTRAAKDRQNDPQSADANGLEPYARGGARADPGNYQPISSDLSGLKAKEGSELMRARTREGALGGASHASPAPMTNQQSKQEAEAAAAAEREAQRQEGRRQALADLPKYQAILDGDPAAVRALKAELAALNGKGH
jgi:uncharacterized protein YdaU (DUF1376 family)